jgi:hypothetical protein
MTEANYLDNLPLDTREAAHFLKRLGHPTSINTLTKLRSVGGGPIFQKHGKLVRYRPVRLREYADSRTSPELRSTSEGPATYGGRPKRLAAEREPAQASAA